MDERILVTFEESLNRCNSDPHFLDRFYELFMASSPRVAEKFAHTDFVRQKRALNASLHMMLLAAGDEENGPAKYLHDFAERHSHRDLNVGAEFYDYWLDSLLAAVKATDPKYNQEIHNAWERVMMIGINYMLSRY